MDSRGRDTAALTRVDLESGESEILAQNPRADVSQVMVHPTEKTIQAVASNYDSEQPPEAHMGAVSENVDDEEDDGMDGLMTALEESWAAGDAAALAMLYTENAHASFASQSVVEGRAAIETRFTERMAGTLDIHAKGTMDLGDGWAVNGGWYETMDDSGHNVGNYLLLARATEDGGHQIHWLVTNGRPAPEETEE